MVFPSARGVILSNMSLSRVWTASSPGGTVHGLRSSFRDWAAETGVDRALAESALGHVVGGVEGAYLRSALIERRRPVMQAWADYLNG
jgi:integrase